MAKAASRQQKLAAKAARRKAVVADKKRLDQASNSLPGKIALAAACPVERCLRSDSVFEAGIGEVVIARRLPSQVLGCAFFLVDVHCLGVKSVFYREFSPLDLDDWVKQVEETHRLIPMDPACARKLVRGAVAYAAKAKLPPGKDYHAIEKIFGDADAESCAEAFTFGKDGKPLFIAGPRDTPKRIDEISRALDAAYGSGNWNYVIDLSLLRGAGGGRDHTIFGDEDDGGPLIEHDDDEFRVGDRGDAP